MTNIIKLSDIEKAIQKKIEIKEGVPQWVTHKLNGDILFYNPTEPELAKEINEEVIQNLKGDESEEMITYLLLPYITNIENDISLEQFKKLINSKNSIILMLQEGIISLITEIFNFTEYENKLKEENKNMFDQIEQLKLKEETIEEKIIRLTKEMESEKDTRKKKDILLELAKLYEKVEKNG